MRPQWQPRKGNWQRQPFWYRALNYILGMAAVAAVVVFVLFLVDNIPKDFPRVPVEGPTTPVRLQVYDLQELDLEDGTRCVMVRGTGIDCNWKKN